MSSVISILRESLKQLKPLTAPIPTDVYARERWAFANAHYALINGLLSVQKHITTDAPFRDKANFLGFTKSVVKSVLVQHRNKEEALYPLMELHGVALPVDYETLYESYLPQVDRFREYLQSCLNGTTKFSLEAAQGHIDRFAEPMARGLIQELDNLKPSILRERYTEKEMRAQEVGHVNNAKKLMNPAVEPMMVLLHVADRGVFPQLPWIMKSFLLPWVVYWVHAGYWKYAPGW